MAEKLWGGRFNKKTHTLVDEFTNSIHFDYKLAAYDCLGSLIHIDILKKAKLLTPKEHAKLKKALKAILSSIDNGSFFKDMDSTCEDIHSAIQSLTEKKAKEAALKLHTCRSRNDQVVFDTKLYCLENCVETLELLIVLDKALNELAKKNKNIIMPGYTHMQHAIPISLYNYLHAYHMMLSRDEAKLLQIFQSIDLTMGSGALAGTFIPSSCYTQDLKPLLGAKVSIQASENAIDTVSSRDFIIDILSALSVIGLHLSRLAEDLILWSTKEFDFIDIDDAFCTGSSLMPNKKNPDVLELIRGNTGKLYGHLISVLVMMKGLPLSYNRDMQLDKEPLFESFEIVQQELEVCAELLKNVKFNQENIAKQLDDESLYATDLADYLVQHGIPFKEAHVIIGRLIKHKCKGKKEIQLRDMTNAELKKFHPLLSAQIVRTIMNPVYSVNSKKSIRKRKKK
ncbi:MAG: argininosuccinate lyase [Candidatus Omnitrophota bacterium]